MSILPQAIQKNGFKKEDVAKREFKHACYSPSVRNESNDDLLIIKELVTLKDGTTRPNLLMLKNFERDFGVTKKSARNHEEKKEFEHMDNLKMYTCTERELTRKVATALGIGGNTKRLYMGELAESPYLYGSTIDSRTIVKHQYDMRWPDNRTNFSVGALDFETDMINKPKNQEFGDPIIGSYFSDGKAFLTIDRDFLKEFKDPEKLIRAYIDEHLSDVLWDHNEDRIKIRQEDLIIQWADHPVKLIKTCTDDLHAMAPDLVSIWNISFDFPMMIDCCQRYNARPEDILSDPRVPREFRKAYYKEGKKFREKANGDKVPVDANDRWDNMFLSASWQPICGLRAYKKLRPTESKQVSYGLDFLAKKHLKKIGKFKPPGTEHMDSESFHIHMQTKEKIAYCAYALLDPMLCIWLEQVTNDLGVKLPLQCYYSAFDAFPSGPRKNEDEMYYELRLDGYLQASTSSDMTTKWCKYIPDSSNWITLLEPHLCHPDIGLKIMGESVGEGDTLIAISAFDIDVTGAYPTTGVAANISKSTTKFEIVGYEHLDKQRQRMIGFHLSNPRVNCIDLTKIVYQATELVTLRNEIAKDIDFVKPDGYDDYFDPTGHEQEIYGI